ncbi:hypothetical protein ACWEOG_02155 [Amycolatopsis japonica]
MRVSRFTLSLKVAAVGLLALLGVALAAPTAGAETGPCNAGWSQWQKYCH